MLRERKVFIGTTCAIITCAAALMFSTGQKKVSPLPPVRGFENAQVLLDAVNNSNVGQGISLGKNELKITALMKEKDALENKGAELRANLETEKTRSNELTERIGECDSDLETCTGRLSDAVKQNIELGTYFARCLDSNLKSFHIIKYYFGVVDNEELGMIEEENKKAGCNAKMTDAEQMFLLFDYFRNEIKPQASEKGQLPRRVGAVLRERKGDCDEQAIAFAWQAITLGFKARVVFVDYGKTSHAYPQILIGGNKEYAQFVAMLKTHYNMDNRLFKKIVQMGTEIECGRYWFTFDTTGPVPGIRKYPDFDMRTRVVYPGG